MRSKWIAGAAALAMAASVTQAQPGKGNGGGNGKGQGNAAAQADRGGGGGPKADRGNRGGPPARAQRGNGNGQSDRAQRAARPDRGPPAARGNRGGGPPAIRGGGNGNRNASRANGAANVDVRFDRRGTAYRGGEVPFPFMRDNRGLVNGCPPGLAKKNNGCQPPGQAKKRFGGALQPSFFGLGGFGSGSYFYDDGFLLRFDGGNVSGYIPLLGGALSVGNPWPDYYQPVEVPAYYSNYYNLGAPGGYRYADNVLYRIDPESAAITSIAALLTGDTFRVGQPLPSGYGIYNVPYAYRDRYYDSPDAYYRYSDGYVYQVDPETMLIASAIELAL